MPNHKAVKIVIGYENAAFADDGNRGGSEMARILRKLADEFEHHGHPEEQAGLPLRDINGNEVGGVTVSGL